MNFDALSAKTHPYHFDVSNKTKLRSLNLAFWYDALTSHSDIIISKGIVQRPLFITMVYLKLWVEISSPRAFYECRNLLGLMNCVFLDCNVVL